VDCSVRKTANATVESARTTRITARSLRMTVFYRGPAMFVTRKAQDAGRRI
jgi:hypothetical protein